MAGIQPYAGEVHQLEKLDEYKVEMVCPDAVIKEVVQTLLEAHPYEQPAYAVYKILTVEDL